MIVIKEPFYTIMLLLRTPSLPHVKVVRSPQVYLHTQQACLFFRTSYIALVYQGF
jgi:hypothetical protein